MTEGTMGSHIGEQMLARFLVIALVAFSVAGCANQHALFERFNVDGGESIAIDAKQRVVVAVKKTYKKQGPDGSDLEWRAFCAEPSPDALSSISASAGVNLEVLQKALSAALSSSETAANIGLRTQTIQLLRDAMYRLCEGYASGALDDIGYTRLQRRYQNIMMGLLAIEQLTGVVAPKQVILGSNAIASTGQSLNQMLAALDVAQKAKAEAVQKKEDASVVAAAAKKKLDEAKAAREELLKANNNDEKAAAVVEFDTKTYTPAKVANEKAAGAARDASTLAAQASESVESLLKGLENGRKSVASSTASGFFDTTSASSSNVAGTNGATISATVQSIVKSIVERDYTRETCFDTLVSRQAGRIPEDGQLIATAFCLMYLRQDSAKLVAEAKGDAAVLARVQSIDAFAAKLEELLTTQLTNAFARRNIGLNLRENVPQNKME
jgi:hypothetical protein